MNHGDLASKKATIIGLVLHWSFKMCWARARVWFRKLGSWSNYKNHVKV